MAEPTAADFSGGKRFGRSLLAAILLTAGMFQSCKPPETSGAQGAGGRSAKGANQPASVAIAPAKKGDVRVFVTGIGAVTPLNTVTVRSLVDGTLMSVKFEEGRNVSKGELLAIIDPRPFEALLAQASGQLERDSALLTNAGLICSATTRSWRRTPSHGSNTIRKNRWWPSCRARCASTTGRLKTRNYN